ncbi:hypothetical protein [Leminorella grimontii]|uniref:hypothetical protein n=1 Tax=Leminorella grimontii TaxID=82981 RepID=UPI0032206B14
MENKSLLEKRRKNFIDSVFYHLRKNKKTTTCLRVIDDYEYEFNLDETVLSKALESLYENNVCRQVMALTDGEIISTYAELYTVSGNLTKAGTEFLGYITELIANRLHQKAQENE